MDGFTFIHSGDLHLGKRFGHLPEEARAGPIRARADLPTRLAAVARQAGARDVLLAGDTFDSETPTPAVLRQAMTAMATEQDLTWWILPGNHDSLAAEALWERAAPAGNVRLLAEAAPVEMAPGVWLLPAPVPSRFPAADPTAPMADAATPEGAVRIGLAHGGIVDFSARGDGGGAAPGGTIAPDRAASAGLSYLALGDWHAARAVGPRTWYAGTPEPDGFRHGQPGRCLAVTLPGRAADAAPQVRECETGQYLWRAPELAVTPRDDPAALLRAALPEAPPDWRRTLVRARAEGRCALPAREALRAAADGLAPEFCHFEIDLRALRVEVSPDDLDAIAQSGALRHAARALQAEAADPAEDPRARDIASAALARLYALVRETSG